MKKLLSVAMLLVLTLQTGCAPRTADAVSDAAYYASLAVDDVAWAAYRIARLF